MCQFFLILPPRIPKRVECGLLGLDEQLQLLLHGQHLVGARGHARDTQLLKHLRHVLLVLNTTTENLVVPVP